MLDHGEVQAALSARLDGEPAGYPDDVVDAHLANCRECQEFYREAIALSQALGPTGNRAEPEEIPDLSAVILAGVEPEWQRRASSRALGLVLTRIFLVLAGLVFVAWSVTLLGNAPTEVVDPGYSDLLVESAALRLALGFGLFFAAWQPRLVVGMLPIVGALFTFSAGFAARDVILGTADMGQLGHIFLLFVTLGVLVWSWLNNYGADAFRDMWQSFSARPH